MLTIDVEYRVAGFAPKLLRHDPSFGTGFNRFAGLHELGGAHLETLRKWPEKR